MTSPYIGEIRMFGGNFNPYGWALCNGQILQISDYTALFSLIGNAYGGDGITNFALPNLQGRAAVHTGPPNFSIGNTGGSETVTLTSGQLPMHSHSFLASANPATQKSPVNNTPGAVSWGSAYAQYPADVPLAAQSITSDGGGGQPHNNVQPYQCISFIIALTGIYPSQG